MPTSWVDNVLAPRLALVAVSFLLLSGCGGGATKTVTVQPGAAHQSAARTAVHVYAPYSAEGKLLVQASQTASGSCFTGSIISQRSDAWRCTAGNELQDPCFAGALNSHSVVCPENGPWSGKVIRLTLAEGLPSSAANILRDNNSNRPPLTDPAWAIELVGGEHCLFVSGTSTLVGELRENYYCTSGLSLYGNESRTTELWTIFGRQGTTGQLTPESIASIWF